MSKVPFWHAPFVFLNNILITGMKKILILFLAFLPLLANAQTYNVDYNAPISLSNNQKAVKTSTDVILVALPVATLAGVLINQDWEGLKQGVFTGLTTVGATYILKAVVHEQRPDRSSWDSFPSGHTSATFATAGFLQRRYGWKFGVPAYVLSTYVAWGRCFARRHHVWDVVAGAAIGSAAAYIFTTPWAKAHSFAMSPVATDTHLGVTASLSF